MYKYNLEVLEHLKEIGIETTIDGEDFDLIFSIGMAFGIKKTTQILEEILKKEGVPTEARDFFSGVVCSLKKITPENFVTKFMDSLKKQDVESEKS